MRPFYVLLLCVGALFSQELSPARDAQLFKHPLSEAALAALLPNMKTTMQRHPVARATFVQLKEVPGLDSTLRSTGSVLFSQKRGVVWRVETPVKMEVVMSSLAVKTAYKDTTSEYQFSGAQSGKIQGLMQAVYQGDLRDLQTLFLLYYHKSDGLWRMGLQPKRGRMKRFMQAIVVEGNQQGEILRVSLVAANGARTGIFLTPSKEGHRPLTPNEEKLFVQK